jgi:hypothetical protein
MQHQRLNDSVAALDPLAAGRQDRPNYALIVRIADEHLHHGADRVVVLGQDAVGQLPRMKDEPEEHAFLFGRHAREHR